MLVAVTEWTIHLLIRSTSAFMWPRLGPRGAEAAIRHSPPASAQSPQMGRLRSHLSFRSLHFSQALPGFCRDRGAASD